jgi:hypothetical protein
MDSLLKLLVDQSRAVSTEISISVSIKTSRTLKRDTEHGSVETYTVPEVTTRETTQVLPGQRDIFDTLKSVIDAARSSQIEELQAEMDRVMAS